MIESFCVLSDKHHIDQIGLPDIGEDSVYLVLYSMVEFDRSDIGIEI